MYLFGGCQSMNWCISATNWCGVWVTLFTQSTGNLKNSNKVVYILLRAFISVKYQDNIWNSFFSDFFLRNSTLSWLLVPNSSISFKSTFVSGESHGGIADSGTIGLTLTPGLPRTLLLSLLSIQSFLFPSFLFFFAARLKHCLGIQTFLQHSFLLARSLGQTHNNNTKFFMKPRFTTSCAFLPRKPFI